MADLNKTCLYRMIHIESVSHILQHGIIHVSSAHANKGYKAIGDGSIISSRHSINLPYGKNIGDFIPFYFGVRMPMLLVIQRGYNSVPINAVVGWVVYNLTAKERLLAMGIPERKIQKPVPKQLQTIRKSL